MAKAATALQTLDTDLLAENIHDLLPCDSWPEDELRSTTNNDLKTELASTSNGRSMVPDTEDSNAAATFRYKPLDLSSGTFRLIKVLPGADTEVVQCELLHSTLGEGPGYTALSYTWDHDADLEEIEVHGKSLPVTKNLHRFLAQLRRTLTNQGRYLWVDAICIDQGNIKERNHQVGQMRKIYSNADSVIVWLGEAVDGAQLAFGLLRGPRQLISGNGRHRKDRRRDRVDSEWKALERLLNRPYWGRVWIIQEFVLARSVELWCGDLFTDLDSLHTLGRWLGQKWFSYHETSSRILQSKAWTLSEERASWWQCEGTSDRASYFSLQNLLTTYFSSMSTDVRDRVYALLGIASDITNNSNPLHPDYAKSPVEILVDVVRNQCQLGSLQEDTEKLKLICLLKETLGVSHSEAGRYVLECAPDLHRYVHMIASTEFMYAPMHCIGTVIKNGFDLTSDGLTSTRSTQSRSRFLENISIDPRRLSASAVSGLTDHLKKGEETNAILSCAINRTFARKPESTSLVPDISQHAQHAVAETTAASTITNGLEQSYAQSFAIAMASHMIAKEREMTAEQTPDIFIGTDGIIGLTSCTALPGDHICTLTETENSKIALIMRDSIRYSTWAPIGTAVIVRQELENIDPPGQKKSLPIQQQPKQTSNNGKTIHITLPSRVFAKGTQLQYFFRPTSLPELVRCKFLDASFLPRVLNQPPGHSQNNGGLTSSVSTFTADVLGSVDKALGEVDPWELEWVDLNSELAGRGKPQQNTEYAFVNLDDIRRKAKAKAVGKTSSALDRARRWHFSDEY